MTLLQNINIKKLKEENKILKFASFGKCYDCTCFQADGYKDCTIKFCPLYPNRLRQPKNRWSKNLASYLTVVKSQNS